ncbi:MAG: tetratricopeptide repeat protein [Ktedonobacteraceae bacterium]
MEGDPVPDLQAQIVEARLSIGQTLIAEGKAADAERVYLQALKHAEKAAGQESPLAGMVLLDLIDLYEAKERHDEAKALWERVRNILMQHSHKLRSP